MIFIYFIVYSNLLKKMHKNTNKNNTKSIKNKSIKIKVLK